MHIYIYIYIHIYIFTHSNSIFRNLIYENNHTDEKKYVNEDIKWRIIYMAKNSHIMSNKRIGIIRHSRLMHLITMQVLKCTL